jgi:hypothetical protein
MDSWKDRAQQKVPRSGNCGEIAAVFAFRCLRWLLCIEALCGMTTTLHLVVVQVTRTTFQSVVGSINSMRRLPQGFLLVGRVALLPQDQELGQHFSHSMRMMLMHMLPPMAMGLLQAWASGRLRLMIGVATAKATQTSAGLTELCRRTLAYP